MKRARLAFLVASTLAAGSAAAEPITFEETITSFANSIIVASADDARASADAWRRWADDFSHEMRASMGAMYGGRVSSMKNVKGAPYSADVVTESNRTLGDGNVIQKSGTGRVYRDGEGRTRQETAGDGKEPTVYIGDPVEKRNIVLTPGSKKAIVTPRHVSSHDHHDRHVMRFGSKEIRIEDGKVFLDGKAVPDGKVELEHGGKKVRVENGKVTVDGKPMKDGSSKVFVRTTSDHGDGSKREEVRVEIVSADGAKEIVIPVPRTTPPVPPVPPVPPIPPMNFNFDFPGHGPALPGAHTMRFESTAKLGKGTTTALGTKDFDGVKAEGKSTVWTIPAGQVGNRNPINITSESWYSPELQVTVYSRYNDPRQGESIYRLSHIKRGEPSAELFKVPEGYTQKGRGAQRQERDPKEKEPRESRG